MRVILLALALCCSSVSGLQPLGDDDSVKFVIEVNVNDTTQYQVDEQPEGSRIRLMTDSKGRNFQCHLPPSLNANTTSSKQAAHPEQRPSQLLEPLQSTCLYRQEDWWTYEVCPKKHVRQFHQHGQELLSQYQLGNYDGNASNVDRILEDDSAALEGRYVQEVYNGGEACDLTQSSRLAEVHYVCSEGWEGIQSIREPATCTYVFVVGTPRLCKHAALRIKQVSLAKVSCQPVGTREGDFPPGWGGPPRRHSPPLQGDSALAGLEGARDASLWARPWLWLAHGPWGMWGGWSATEQEGQGEEQGEAEPMRMLAEEGAPQEVLQGAQDAMGMDPEAVQALANELQRTLMAAFGQQGGGSAGEGDRKELSDEQVEKMQADMEENVAAVFAEHLQVEPSGVEGVSGDPPSQEGSKAGRRKDRQAEHDEL